MVCVSARSCFLACNNRHLSVLYLQPTSQTFCINFLLQVLPWPHTNALWYFTSTFTALDLQAKLWQLSQI